MAGDFLQNQYSKEKTKRNVLKIKSCWVVVALGRQADL